VKWFTKARVCGGGGWIQASATIDTPSATFSESRTISGWIGGGGIEWAFAGAKCGCNIERVLEKVVVNNQPGA